MAFLPVHACTRLDISTLFKGPGVAVRGVGKGAGLGAAHSCMRLKGWTGSCAQLDALEGLDWKLRTAACA